MLDILHRSEFAELFFLLRGIDQPTVYLTVFSLFEAVPKFQQMNRDTASMRLHVVARYPSEHSMPCYAHCLDHTSIPVK